MKKKMMMMKKKNLHCQCLCLPRYHCAPHSHSHSLQDHCWDSSLFFLFNMVYAFGNGISSWFPCGFRDSLAMAAASSAPFTAALTLKASSMMVSGVQSFDVTNDAICCCILQRVWVSSDMMKWFGSGDLRMRWSDWVSPRVWLKSSSNSDSLECPGLGLFGWGPFANFSKKLSFRSRWNIAVLCCKNRIWI